MGRGKKYTAEQIVSLLRQIEVGTANGKMMPQACKEVGITEQTYYRWRKEYGGLQVNQARRLKELEQENAKLKRLVAELSLDKLVLKDIASGNLYAAFSACTWSRIWPCGRPPGLAEDGAVAAHCHVSDPCDPHRQVACPVFRLNSEQSRPRKGDRVFSCAKGRGRKRWTLCRRLFPQKWSFLTRQLIGISPNLLEDAWALALALGAIPAFAQTLDIGSVTVSLGNKRLKPKFLSTVVA